MPVLMLQSHLDGQAAKSLREAILSSVDGEKISLDASGVEVLGGLCLQVILASRAEIINPSQKMTDALALYGEQGIIVPAQSPDAAEALS